MYVIIQGRRIKNHQCRLLLIVKWWEGWGEGIRQGLKGDTLLFYLPFSGLEFLLPYAYIIFKILFKKIDLKRLSFSQTWVHPCFFEWWKELSFWLLLSFRVSSVDRQTGWRGAHCRIAPTFCPEHWKGSAAHPRVGHQENTTLGRAQGVTDQWQDKAPTAGMLVPRAKEMFFSCPAGKATGLTYLFPLSILDIA